MRFLKSFFVGLGFALLTLSVSPWFTHSFEWNFFGMGGYVAIQLPFEPFFIVFILTSFLLGFLWMFRRSQPSR